MARSPKSGKPASRKRPIEQYDHKGMLPLAHGRWLLARNLKAEIDPERVEAYRGSVSLPFEPGAHKRLAVKIVDERGIESLKIIPVP